MSTRMYIALILAFATAIYGVYSSLPYLKDAIRAREIIEHAKSRDIVNTTQEIADFTNDTLTREVYGAIEGIKITIIVGLIAAIIAAFASVLGLSKR